MCHTAINVDETAQRNICREEDRTAADGTERNGGGMNGEDERRGGVLDGSLAEGAADMQLNGADSRRESCARETMRLQIESRSRNEEFARVAVAAFASRLDPTLMEIDDLKTAVSEAVTNAVIHGYRGGDGIIYIEASVCGRELTVTVRDTGVGIPDIPKAMEPMFTTDPAGERSGMGFAFMEAFMDQVEVRSEVGRGTTVTMKKQMGG